MAAASENARPGRRFLGFGGCCGLESAACGGPRAIDRQPAAARGGSLWVHWDSPDPAADLVVRALGAHGALGILGDRGAGRPGLRVRVVRGHGPRSRGHGFDGGRASRWRKGFAVPGVMPSRVWASGGSRRQPSARGRSARDRRRRSAGRRRRSGQRPQHRLRDDAGPSSRGAARSGGRRRRVDRLGAPIAPRRRWQPAGGRPGRGRRAVRVIAGAGRRTGRRRWPERQERHDGDGRAARGARRPPAGGTPT
jgi:hypothetical protein